MDLTFLFLSLMAIHVHAADWSYSDTNLWNTEFKDYCGGERQSPVNVYKGEVAKDDSLQPFTMTNYDTTADQPYLLENNGHSAKVTVMGSRTPTISGGGLSTDYELLQFHFHWGSDDNQGSEHTIGGKKYPMELHLVHMKSGLNLTEALNTGDGLAVLGFMFEVTDTDDANYDSLVSALSSVKEKGDKVNITVASMNTFLPTTKSNFYRYLGSLTTPYCNEAVIWSVFTDPISISETQLAEFRKLQTAKSMDLVNNYRLPQPLNGRKLTSNFDVDYHWGYEHEDEWSPNYESCGMSSQSPVNIPTNFAEYDEKYGAITFNNYTATTGFTMEITNNGHTVKVSVTTSEDISIEGGGLPTKYKIAQFHFHWGANNNKGSEHTIDSKQYPMEIHFVHYNASKASISDALTEHQGLAVLGFMFEIGDEDNTALEPIIDELANIKNPNDKKAINFVLSSILPSSTDDFYRYSGSLTTPPCYESVVWTVFKDAISISESQLSKFRELLSSEKDDDDKALNMVDNFREIQELNTRPITRSYNPHWGYFGDHDASHWEKYWGFCNDTPTTSRQSPIDIDNENTDFKNIDEFKFHNYNSDNHQMTLKNNGHTATVAVTGDASVTKGGLASRYSVAQFHFHWGSKDSQGSEHLVESKGFPIEAHIVHFKSSYGTIGNAVKKGDGLAVLGILFEVSDTDNEVLNPLVNELDKVIQPYSETAVTGFALDQLLPSSTGDFYRYSGSLTTPGCYESVTWTVFRKKVKISKSQLDKFRALKSSEKEADGTTNRQMVDNFRPPQNKHSRIVVANFYIGVSSRPSGSIFLISVSLLSLLKFFKLSM